MSRDNTTSQPAEEYATNIRMTMPRYQDMHDTVLNYLEILQPQPKRWLDAGSGTGTLVELAAERFPGTEFIVSDPSTAVLDIAKDKVAQIAVRSEARAQMNWTCPMKAWTSSLRC